MKNYVLITGASEGFGVELAKVFSKNAHNTILIARSLDKIKKLADEIKKDYKTDSRAYKCNISNSSDIDRIIKNIKNQKLNVDILVNNAGISNFGEFSNNSDDDIIEILRVNVIGMTYLTKKIVDGMINNKSGKILNISSIVGYYPLPYQAVYAASKAYVLSFSQALHSELKDKSVHVSTLCPANIKTDFNKKAGLEKLYKNYSEKKNRYRMEIEPGMLADITYKEFMEGKRIIYSDRILKRMIYLLRLLSIDKLTDKHYKIRKRIIKG